MKKLLLPLIFICLESLSCTKTVNLISVNQITGEWRLYASSGGITGTTTYPTDKQTITFDLSNHYTTKRNDTIITQGVYTITKAPEPNYYNSNSVINLITGSLTLSYGLSVSKDSLLLDEGCCDRLALGYSRLK